MKTIIAILVLCLGVVSASAQNTILEKRISVKADTLSMEEAIDKIAKIASIDVSYSSDLFSDCQPVKLDEKEELLLIILNKLLASYRISYTVHAGQLIFYPKKTIIIENHTIKGTIRSEETGQAISYATLQIKGKPKGVVADDLGYFELTLTNMELADSLTASCMGYERRSFNSDTLLSQSEVTIFLKQQPVNIQAVTVTANKLAKKVKRVGNRGWFNRESIYLDTHGQQIALFIENKQQLSGYIRKVSYHLSKDGNSEAPFRIRIFDVDTLTHGPGNDLLSDILVVQPPEGTDGWFDIDLSEYEIYVPAQGFFVAIQGVFPNDYSFYTNDSEFIKVGSRQSKSNRDFIPTSIHYGQRINYSGKGGRDTWHYSLSHQWFQMERDNYSVKISAEIGVFSEK